MICSERCLNSNPRAGKTKWKVWKDLFIFIFYLFICLFLFYFQVHLIWSAATAAKSLQSCPTLSDPRDGSTSGSTVPGILQARTLEWVAISFSDAWKWSRSVVSDPQRPHGLQPSRLLRPWDFPGKSTGVERPCLLRSYGLVSLLPL